MSELETTLETQGQINPAERGVLTDVILKAEPKPTVVLEVGTWLGGGSTVHILHALEENNTGHLWGIEADRSIYEQMIRNIRGATPTASHRFTPLFGLSQQVIPQWLENQGALFKIDFAFLDGGNNPMEQITEFQLIDPHIPVGGTLMAHDAKLRKGKWLIPYVSTLDNWECKLHDISDEGLFVAKKKALHPSPQSLRAARSRLRRLRFEPAELAATLLSSGVCNFILNLMPEKSRRRIAEGRNQL